MRPRYFLFFLVSAIVLGLDIFTKKLALDNLSGSEALEIIPGLFNLVLVFNQGAAFGFLGNTNDTWQIWLFLGVTAITIGVIICLMHKIQDNKPAFFGLALILGGALGNMVDRIRYQAVVDFLDFYWQTWHWPAFNVADTAICTGAGLALLALWRQDRHKAAARKNS